VIDLFEFQYKASAQITSRFSEYMKQRPGKVVGTKVRFTPFYQALASITASGKTVIMAESVAELLPLMPIKPVVLWISKGRVVVDQTYANLNGRYRNLLAGYEDVHLLADYSRDDVENEDLALVYLATVGTWNQQSKDKSTLKLFQSDLDHADQSIWSALTLRETESGLRRPLVIVYDEAHNLTDQQTGLLLDLEPDVLLLASATPKLPPAILRMVDDLKEALDWDDSHLTTYVKSSAVVDAGLVKRRVVLGGYQAQMEETIDDLLDDMAAADKAAIGLGLPLAPKAIYVCRTNIVEGNANQRDDPKRPFTQRQAPPILIWRYLVGEKGVDPATIAVYTSALKFDKDHPPPADFVLFKGGDNDYANFVSGGYRHIIFNLGLQEGWDDPLCYFAYIDKSMQSKIQVEQVIGRVLRQPGARHYEDDLLNAAHFYVRVDAKTAFTDIVQEVDRRLGGELPEIQISSYDPKKKNKPVPYEPQVAKEVPHIWRDPSAAMDPIDQVITKLIDFRGDTSDNIRGGGAKALVQRQVGKPSDPEWEWVERDHGNAVSARWIFQTAVRRQFPLALEVTRSDDPKFDAKIELGSIADETMRKAADEVVSIYLQHIVLRQRAQNPYEVGDTLVDPTAVEKFSHAVHAAYSGLNKTLELPFARELDKTRLRWCRNPSQSGFPIPLLTPGQSRTFYPDFLAWKGKVVFAIDTKGEHILESELGRKLLAITSPPKAKLSLVVRLVSPGKWDKTPQRQSGEGFTVWTLGQANALKPIHCATLADAVKTSVNSDL
jgi:type III restriction enzyme